MEGMPDRPVWVLALAVAALFVWFFWHSGAIMLDLARQLIGTIQNWPQTRHAMADAEAQAGGRYPFWFRATRVLLVIALIVFAALLLWRKVNSV